MGNDTNNTVTENMNNKPQSLNNIDETEMNEIKQGPDFEEDEYKLKLVKCASNESVGLVLSNVKDNGEPYPYWCVTEVKRNGMGARVGIQQYDFIVQIHNIKISIYDDIISKIGMIRKEIDVYSMILKSKNIDIVPVLSNGEVDSVVEEQGDNDKEMVEQGVNERKTTTKKTKTSSRVISPVISVRNILKGNSSSESTSSLTSSSSRKRQADKDGNESMKDITLIIEPDTCTSINEKVIIPGNKIGTAITKPFQEIQRHCYEKIRKVIISLSLFRIFGGGYSTTEQKICSTTEQKVCNFVFSKLIEECKYLNDKRDWVIHSELKGPQPWMLTRRYIVETILKEYYHNTKDSWLHSQKRRDQLYATTFNKIKMLLTTWKDDLKYSDILSYCAKIWKRFILDHENKQPVLKLYSLNEMYVHVTAAVLEFRSKESKTLELPIPSTIEDASLYKNHIRRALEESSYLRSMLPFCTDFTEISEKVWTRYSANKVVISEKFVGISMEQMERIVGNILEDLEDDYCLLSHANQTCVVKVKLSFFASFMKKDISDNSVQSSTNSEEEKEESDNEESSAIQIVETPPLNESLSKETELTLSTDTTPEKIKPKPDNKKRPSPPPESDPLEVSNNSFDFGPSQSEELSSSKDVGSRVYAQYTNGEYYWGYIGQIIDVSHRYHHLKDKNKVFRYKILFDDGCVLDDGQENKIFTEAQYKEIWGQNPPKASGLGSYTRRSKRSPLPRKRTLGEEQNDNQGPTTRKKFKRLSKKSDRVRRKRN